MGIFNFNRNNFLKGGQGFSAARMLRQFKNWVTSHGSPDGEIIADLPTLRTRARDLHKNNSLARAAEETLVRNVIGPGLKMQTAVDYDAIARELNLTAEEAEKVANKFEHDIEALWYEYYNSKMCDARGVSDGPSLTRLMFSSVLQSGDVFATFPRQDGFPRLGLIEADQVQNPLGRFSNMQLRDGVLVSDSGVPVGYMVNTNQEQWPEKHQYIPKYGTESDRPLILHLFREERPGQNRGIPWVSPVIEQLKNLDGYKKSEITAALVSSFLTFFAERTVPSGRLLPGGGLEEDPELGPDFKAAPAAILEVPYGIKMTAHNPARANSNTVGFLESVIKEVGAALGVPFEILVAHYTTSFTSARAARIEFWKTVTMWRDWLCINGMNPWYHEFLADAIISGKVEAPGFFTNEKLRRAWSGCNWYGPALGQINEKVEAEAIQTVVMSGGKSATAAFAEAYGTDYEDTMRQLKREKAFRQRLGLTLSIDERPANAAPLPAATPIEGQDEIPDTPTTDEPA